MSRLRSLLATLAILALLVTSVLAWTYSPQPTPQGGGSLLAPYSSSLTTGMSSSTAAQGLCPDPCQRGLGLDGVPVMDAPHDLFMGANPIEKQAKCPPRRKLNHVDLAKGVYSETVIDISLPSIGFPWEIGRTYNPAGGCGGVSDGYQGKNWGAFSGPEIVYVDDGSTGATADDMVYIVTGANSYAEYRREGTSDFFHGVNGSGGVVEATTSGSYRFYVFRDIFGKEATFFDPDDVDSGDAAGQLWKIKSPNSSTDRLAYAGFKTDIADTIQTFGAGEGPSVVYDASGRRFTYTYSGTPSRLESVVVELDPDDDDVYEEECARIEHDYYGGSYTANGASGELALVTVTLSVDPDEGSEQVLQTHYRYYKDADGGGDDHDLKMVIKPEGMRRYGSGSTQTLSTLDGLSDSTLQSYAESRFEYTSGQITKAWFAGECGCGGSTGEYNITYGMNGSFSEGGSYDTEWKMRAVVEQPDGTYVTQYFDEVAQPLSRIITNGAPGSGSPDTWATRVERDANGLVIVEATPANASSYNHTNGTITPSSSQGLITVTERYTSPTALVGFRELTTWQVGTSPGTKKGPLQGWTLRTQSAGGGNDVVRPYVEEYLDFEGAGQASGEYNEYDATTLEYKWRTSGNPVQLEALRVTYPTVPTSQNGSGVATEQLQYFDDDDQLVYAKAQDGVVSQLKYDEFGQVIETVEDVDYSQSGSTDPSTGSWDFSAVGTGQFHRVTEQTYDCVGRPLETTLPSARVTKRYYSTLSDGRLVSLGYPKYDSGAGTFHGPVDFTVVNHTGRTEESGRIGLTGNSTTKSTGDHVDETESAVMDAFGSIGSAGEEIVRRRRSVYGDTGTKRLESHLYFDLTFTSTAHGVEGTNFDATTYHYDDMGRRVRMEEPSGTVYRTVYDVLGRPTAELIGTNDYNEDGSDDMSGPNNMVTTSETEYDSDSDGGNSLVTKRTAYEDEAGTVSRVTTFQYDLRDRLGLVVSPTKPYTFYGLDYRGRREATGLYSSTSGIDLTDTHNDHPVDVSTGRLALSEQTFDNLGRVFETSRHEIVQSTGAMGSVLESESWYDEVGRLIKHQGQEFYKLEYDRLGRTFNRFDLAELDSTEASNHAYSDADDVTGDIVLEQTQYRYDEEENVILSASIFRHHNDKGAGETTGALDTDADADSLKLTYGNLEGRAHITARWYDELARLRTSANFGTFDDSTFNRNVSGGVSEPTVTVSHSTSTELVLVTKNEYGTDGAVLTVTDENGTPNRTERDGAGRVVKEIRNYVNGNPLDSAPDEDLVVEYTYEDGLQIEYIADRENTSNDQVTTYEYGTSSSGDSEIDTGHLLQRVIYPDGDTSDDNVTYAYNAQGEQIRREDQAGNVLEREYDASGRLLDLEASYIETSSASFNDVVQLISRAYDDLGRLSSVKQYDAPSSGSLLDEVSFTYDDWGMREDFVQDINANSVGYTLTNEWEEATGGRQTLRLKKQTYPSAKYMEPYYGSTHNLFDDAVSRVTALKVDGSLEVAYDYAGAGWTVRTEYMDLDVQRSLHDGAGSPSSLTYDAIDSLGRITHDRWQKINTGATLDPMFHDVRLTYDATRNVLDYSADAVTTGFDVNYEHDAAERLSLLEEGTLSGSNIGTHTRTEDWELDALGNWAEYYLDLDGVAGYTGTGELKETRGHNTVNELEDRDTDSDSSVDYTLAYDAVGNLVDDGEDYKYEYDVFGRRTAVLDQNDSKIVGYRYNGLGYLIQELDVASSEKCAYVYDGSWRLVAKYDETTLSSGVGDLLEEYVYHRAGANGLGGSSYTDLVAFRDRDTDDDQVLDERIWYCQDRLANVRVVLDDDGSVLDYVGYSAYGVPFMSPPGDMDGSGKVTGDAGTGDLGEINTLIANSQYDRKADIDLDGDVDNGDYVRVGTDYRGMQYGRQSLSSSENRVGYKGYRQAFESQWWARNRILISPLGRWDQRDPIGYSDSPSMYVAFGSGLGFVDPKGLSITLPNGEVLPTPGPGPDGCTIPEGEKEVCCRALWENNRDDGGKVACCWGQRVVCSFIPFLSENRGPYSLEGLEATIPKITQESFEVAREAMDECAAKHERGHLDNGESGDCAGKEDGEDAGWSDRYGTKAAQEAAEEMWADVEKECLKRKKKEACGKFPANSNADSTCKQAINERMSDISQG